MNPRPILVHSLLSIAFIIHALGCNSGPALLTSDDFGRQALIETRLPVASPWGPEDQPVRCRILLDRHALDETGVLQAAFVIHNPSEKSVTVPIGDILWQLRPAQPGENPADDVRLHKQLLLTPGESGKRVDHAGVRLAPGQKYITPPTKLFIPPSTGQHLLVARMTPQGQTLHAHLEAGEMELTINPADWGKALNGLRVRLAAARTMFAVGEPPRLHLVIHNTSSRPITLHAVDWDTQNLSATERTVTLRFRTADADYITIEPGLFWIQPLPNPPLLAPGSYLIVAELDSPELSVDHAPAWHGKLKSNELPLEVEAGGEG